MSRSASLSEYESGSLLASPSVFQSAFALGSQLAYALASQSVFPSVYELGFPLVCWSVSELECVSEYGSESLLASPSEFQSGYALGSQLAFAWASQSAFPLVFELGCPLVC